MASQIKSRKSKNRRTQEEIAHIQDQLLAILQEDYPQTVRQVFYAGTVRNLFPKLESSYNLVCRELKRLRLEGRLPFYYLADNTRWVRQASTYGDISELLSDTARLYRRDLWREMSERVEIWIEKDALAGVVFEVTNEFAAPLYVVRGYSSLSYLHSAAETISLERKPTHIYYYGDLDPSGVDIPIKIEHYLREFAPDAEIYFHRAAVNVEQIGVLKLPTRPTKKTDSRAKNFQGESVELDAIPSKVLRQMVRTAIERHVDLERIQQLQQIEQSEREWLKTLQSPFAFEGDY